MILKALYDYYNRSKNDIAPVGMAYLDFYYAIIIDTQGEFLRLEPLGEAFGLSVLTVRPEERTSAPIPHCMGDNGSYVLGLKEVKNVENFDYEKEFKANEKQFDSFRNNIEYLYKVLPNNAYVTAVYRFYTKYDSNILKIMNDSHWTDFCKFLPKNITFRIDGKLGYAVCDDEIIKVKIESYVNDNKETVCLVTGTHQKPVNTTYSTFIFGGKSNAKLVSFQGDSGYDSYGKTMGLNAPISEEAEFKYTTALLQLLSRNSRNKFTLGNRTFLFWASSQSDASEQAEESLFEMLGYSDIDADDPNAKIEQARKVFKSIYSGVLRTDLDDRFYILGLAPNSARIAVVYWSETSLKDFAGKILQHFDDMEIVDGRQDKKPYMGVGDMLSAVTVGGKQSEATPNLPEAVIKSIFQGTPYPYTLFSACIRRLRAESGDKGCIRVGRMAILKAYLNRINDDNNSNQQLNCCDLKLNRGHNEPRKKVANN